MTVSPAFQAALTPKVTVPSIWKATRANPSTFNEGTTVQFTIQCWNAVPGVSKMYWKLSGAKAAPSHWQKSWAKAWNEVMAPRGMRFTEVAPNLINATTGGLVEVLDGYDGLPIVLSNLCLANKRTDVFGGNPGQVQVTLQLAFPDGATGTLDGSGSPFFINDTSKTPLGTPTFRPQLFRADGTSGGGTFNEGDEFIIQLTTENMIPNTKFLFAAVNAGQGKIAGGFQNAIKAACQAVGVQCQTEYAIRGNYNGGVCTFLDGYRDANPIRIPITLTEDHKTTGTLQLDFQTHQWVDGDPDNTTVRYGGTLSVFINDTSVEPTPSYWRLSAKIVGSNIVYGLNSPSGTSDGAVTLNHTGTKPAGFDAALAAAVAGKTGLSLAGNRITSTAAWDGKLTWQVPNPGGAGKHGLWLSDKAAPSLVIIGDACVFFQQPVTPANPYYVTGVNVSGGEFGNTDTNIYGTNYRYPARPENTVPANRYPSIDYHVSRGSGIVRIPVRWERIQRDGFFTPLSGEKDPSEPWNGSTPFDIARIDDLVLNTTSRGVIALLDVHNYMEFTGLGRVGFDRPVPGEALVDLWVRLADRYKNNPLVWFDLMNEPKENIAPTDTRDIMEWLVNAIRSRTGALNRILIAGSFYTGAWSWLSKANGPAFASFRDPANNFLVGMHQYLDSDSSGTKGGYCDVNSWNRLQAATAWLLANGMRGFIGELGFSDPKIPVFEQCGIELPKIMNYVEANKPAWAGVTAWGGGPTFKEDYMYRLDPIGGEDTGQMKVLMPYLKRIEV